jgi:hypothetical protein
MNAPAPSHDWTDINQRCLVAEIARLKARLRGEDEAAAATALEQAREELPAPAAIDQLVERFGLSGFERDLLLLAAAVEMDSEVAALCAAAGSAQRPWASFGLALGMLPDPHWSALTPARPLRRWRLIETSEDAALVTGRLRIDERVLHYVAGVNYLDPRLQPLLAPVPEPDRMADSHAPIAAEIAHQVGDGAVPLPIVQLHGDDPHGQHDIAARAAAHCGLTLYALACEDLPANPHELEALATLWEREAALLDGALLLDCAQSPAGATARRLLERVAGLILVAEREPIVLARGERRYRVDKPSRRDQLRLWEETLDGSAVRLGPALEGVAAEFRLSARDIQRVGAGIGHAAAVSPDPAPVLRQACRDRERLRLDGLAQRIEPAAGWEDLILPEHQKTTLHQIAAQVRHRLTVYERWGFAATGSRGLGISVLFAGESGTGKTMAAEVLASELHLDLYRIDLSAVVSKYIGETEKNLARVFDAAEDSGTILLFDEADALFGKRSEVKDSHDRYANIEVSYLLQRMEAYRGLAILTTNQKAALDTAFQRRLRFVVQFPFPDAEGREAIWRGVFPAATPLDGIDYAKLARLHVAGGHIRNIALNAAFLAAEADEKVGMGQLLAATHHEAAKRERPLSETETRGWV